MCLVNGTLEWLLFNYGKEYNTACIVQVDGTTAKGTSIASWSTAQPTGNNCARYFYSSYIDTLPSLRGPTNISQKPGAATPPPSPIFVASFCVRWWRSCPSPLTNIISYDNPFEISGHLPSGFYGIPFFFIYSDAYVEKFFLPKIDIY